MNTVQDERCRMSTVQDEKHPHDKRFIVDANFFANSIKVTLSW